MTKGSNLRHLFGLYALALGTVASAQSPFTHRDGSDEGDTILPVTSYPLGGSQAVARGMARELRLQWLQQDLCDQLGCLVVHNDTRAYKLAEMRVQLLGKDGTPRWGRNQLDHPLLPKEKLIRVKVAPADSCQREIMFVLQHRKTRERLEMETTTNLCPTPKADNVIRLNVKTPQVTVEDETP